MSLIRRQIGIGFWGMVLAYVCMVLAWLISNAVNGTLAYELAEPSASFIRGLLLNPLVLAMSVTGAFMVWGFLTGGKHLLGNASQYLADREYWGTSWKIALVFAVLMLVPLCLGIVWDQGIRDPAGALNMLTTLAMLPVALIGFPFAFWLGSLFGKQGTTWATISRIVLLVPASFVIHAGIIVALSKIFDF
jgi:hypothetical protein